MSQPNKDALIADCEATLRIRLSAKNRNEWFILWELSKASNGAKSLTWVNAFAVGNTWWEELCIVIAVLALSLQKEQDDWIRRGMTLWPSPSSQSKKGANWRARQGRYRKIRKHTTKPSKLWKRQRRITNLFLTDLRNKNSIANRKPTLDGPKIAVSTKTPEHYKTTQTLPHCTKSMGNPNSTAPRTTVFSNIMNLRQVTLQQAHPIRTHQAWRNLLRVLMIRVQAGTSGCDLPFPPGRHLPSHGGHLPAGKRALVVNRVHFLISFFSGFGLLEIAILTQSTGV